MKEIYIINGYGEHPYYSEIVDYVFNPNHWYLEIKCVSDIPSHKDIERYIQERHPLLFKKGIKRIEREPGIKSNNEFNDYVTIKIYF